MATFTRESLSPAGVQDAGAGIQINGTVLTNLHRGSTTATTYHEVHLWASNTGNVAQTIVLGVGYDTGNSPAAKDNAYYEINASETIYIAPGFTLKGDGTAKEIGATLVNNVTTVNVFGYVNVIDQS
jgi:hypothetical protein